MSAASHKAMWMARNYPHIPFERHADDAICHCQTCQRGAGVWSALTDRLAGCKLVLLDIVIAKQAAVVTTAELAGALPGRSS